jgi:hypothetical protein
MNLISRAQTGHPLRSGAAAVLAAIVTTASMTAPALATSPRPMQRDEVDATMIASFPSRPEEFAPPALRNPLQRAAAEASPLRVDGSGEFSYLNIPAGSTELVLNAAQVGNDGSIVTTDGNGHLEKVLVPNWNGALWGGSGQCTAEHSPVVIPIVPGTTQVEFDRNADQAILLDAEHRDLGRYNVWPGC